MSTPRMQPAPRCPNGCKGTVTERARNRVHVSYECDSCGQEWRADRASGKMIARINVLD